MENHLEKHRLKENLSKEEMNHISACHICREDLVRQVEEHEMLSAPGKLKPSVLEQVRRLDVQLIAGTNQISKRLQFFYFSLKVSAAVVCVMTMLIMAPGFSQEFERELQESREESTMLSSQESQWNYYSKIENFTARLGELSKSNREVLRYDKKER